MILTSQSKCLNVFSDILSGQRGGFMARTPRDITDAELSVLEVLWDDGPATIRRLTDVLYMPPSVAHYATVQKLLERLESKGCVVRDRSSAVHVFSAAISREELIGRRLQAVAEKLCGGSLTPLLTHLVRNTRLTLKDRQELRALIEDLDRQKKNRP
jgi:BlaI family transcriptional regulator, penicillinase repressor